MTRLDHFSDDNWFLSNFYPVSVIMDGVGYASVEHAYQAAKTTDIEQRWIFTLEVNPRLTAGQAKNIGQKLQLRDDWEMVKRPIMRELLLQKFSHHVLQVKLLVTKDAYLEEGNYWHDTYWGVCHGKFDGRVCKKHGDHEPIGCNHLGHLLMDVRTHYSRVAATPFLQL